MNDRVRGACESSAQTERAQGHHPQTWQTTLSPSQTLRPSRRAPYEGHELDSFLGKAFEEKPIWKGLYESIHDVFFPPKLPPLELTSTPIPVPDRMEVKTNPGPSAYPPLSTSPFCRRPVFRWEEDHRCRSRSPWSRPDIDVADMLKAPKAANRPAAVAAAAPTTWWIQRRANCPRG